MERIAELKKIIEDSARIAFLGGAGVSTESGIPDFRSEGGIFSAVSRYGQPPEVLLSHSFFCSHTDVFYQYYRESLLITDAEPNPAHYALAKLERDGKLSAVITQNIDGLHQKAGSKTVLELHGSIYRNRCMDCGKEYAVSSIAESDGIPRCTCGGIVKPEVVLYEESLPDGVLESAVSHIQRADTLIVGGTSLVVYPAAGLIRYFHGRHLVLINKGVTNYDSLADLVIHAPIGEVLSAAVGK